MQSIGFQPLKALPSLPIHKGTTTLFISSSLKSTCNVNPNKTLTNGSASLESKNYFGARNSLLVQVGLLATVAAPALAVTGVNYEPDWPEILTKCAIVAFGYFIIMPPIIMNWLRIRWYRRNLLEMYFQFMFVFLFFPGVLLWAPFLNFRKLPRDPTLKYPWSKPENPSEVRGSFLKYPWASIEDYE